MDTNRQVNAAAIIRGSSAHPNLRGIVEFIPQRNGTMVRIQLMGLPDNDKNNYFGLHIHTAGRCQPNSGRNPFNEAGNHYNPENDLHPQHAGDLGNLFSNNGLCRMSILTQRFSVEDILNRTVIIHTMPDNLSHDPSGNSGVRIGCGIIFRNRAQSYNP